MRSIVTPADPHDVERVARKCHRDEVVRSYLAREWWCRETLLDRFDAHVHQRPGESALSDPTNLTMLTGAAPESLNWAQLARCVDDIAARLYGAGIARNDVVAVLLPNSVNLTATLLALWRLGAIAAPMPASYRSHELSRIVSAAAATAVVTVNQFHDRRPALEAAALDDGLRAVFTFGPGGTTGSTPLDASAPSVDDSAAMRHYVARLERSVNDCITICWTSGTEAAPKGVPRCHGDWQAAGWAAQHALEAEPASVILNPFPMVNMAGFASALLPWLFSGGHLVQHHPLDLEVFLQQISDHHVTHTSMAPALLTMLLKRDDLRTAYDISSLRRVGSGGAPLPAGVVRAWQHDLGVEVANFFGSNEGVMLLGAPADIPDPEIRAQHLPNYANRNHAWGGNLQQRTEMRLVDPLTGEVVTRIGQRGELRVKGPAVFAGYLAGTSTTSGFDDDGYLCSGDVFELCGDDGQYVKFVDRSKEIIVRGGMNIAPAEIEGLLIDHPAVRDVAVVAYPDEVMGEKCCAVVVPTDGPDVALADLVAFLRRRDVASFKFPERLVITDSLPRNAVGKLLRRELQTTVNDEGSRP